MFLKIFFSSFISIHGLFPSIKVLTKFTLNLIFSPPFLPSFPSFLLPSFYPSLLPSLLLIWDLHRSLPFSLQLVDYYTDGQPCDETGGTRSTDVHIQCCTGLHVNSPNKDIVTSVTQRNQPHARLNGNPNPPVINEVHTHVDTAVARGNMLTCNSL